jgi:hypothetical protein
MHAYLLCIFLLFNIDFNLNEITIDSINLVDARYNLKDFGKVVSQREWEEEYEDYSRRL